MQKAASPRQATDTTHSTSLARTILKVWKLGSVGRRARASNGRFGMIGHFRIEYDYYGFGTNSVTFIDNVSGTIGPLDVKQNIQVIMLGLNFHPFAWPAEAPARW